MPSWDVCLGNSMLQPEQIPMGRLPRRRKQQVGLV